VPFYFCLKRNKKAVDHYQQLLIIKFYLKAICAIKRIVASKTITGATNTDNATPILTVKDAEELKMLMTLKVFKVWNPVLIASPFKPVAGIAISTKPKIATPTPIKIKMIVFHIFFSSLF